MKRIFYPLLLTALLAGCASDQTATINRLTAENDTLKQRNEELQKTVEALKLPAADRYRQIKRLVAENQLSEAEQEIANLKTLFPLSEEARLCDQQTKAIADKFAAQKAEEERIKALGFKAFTDNPSFRLGTTEVAVSGFTFGRTYTYDYCGDVDRYWYLTADKDNTFLLANVVVSTQTKEATLPSFGVYEVQDGKLKGIISARLEYATWSSYGAKLGNYRDDSHDFSKVNSVKYKLAAEVSQEQSKKPLFLLVRKAGGECGLELTIEEVKSDYIVVKIMNKEKM